VATRLLLDPRFSFGRGLFAIASASLAIYSLTYADFAPAGQSLPAWLPWRQLWVYGSALLVLAASAGLCFRRTALASALTIGAYLAVWALISVPQILLQPLSIGAWYGFCEATTSLVGAWMLYDMSRSQLQGSARAAQVLFGLTCVFYGWSHFAYADYTASMVPVWLPGRLGFAYLTGLGHVAAGAGIMLGILPRLAATLEALMMSLFGLLVWVPSFFAQPRPTWATPPQNQWSELVVNLVLAASAWIVAISLSNRPWGLTATSSKLAKP
jgi:uncharacterized membrane protein YphA (DoxX/SURF4 family)